MSVKTGQAQLGQRPARIVKATQQNASGRDLHICEGAPLGRNVPRQEGKDVATKLVATQIPRDTIKTGTIQMRQQRRGER
ncbi:hypothetical protein [Actinoplanes sp. NPDC049802]|uniref:hypothetical protein n=1 Tax=Actinoplanes sp. NPDC049802 TaxID=3154742 RepID=UPI0033FC73A3